MLMRKLTLLILAAMMGTTGMKAQNGYDETKQEVAVGLGVLPNSQFLDMFEKVGGALAGAKFENEKFFGPISAEYFYHVKPWLGLGGIIVYGQNKQDTYLNHEMIGKNKNTYITLMPAAKFDWLHKQHFGMYSKLALGATLRNEKYDRLDGRNSSDSELHVNWQISPLGLEAGSPTVRGFVELGFGEQGIALAGLRYKF